MCSQQISCKIKQPFFPFFFFFRVLQEKRLLEKLSYNKQVWTRIKWAEATSLLEGSLTLMNHSVIHFPPGAPSVLLWPHILKFFQHFPLSFWGSQTFAKWSPGCYVFFKILKSNCSHNVAGHTFCICLKMQQPLSQPFINWKGQAATKIGGGLERKIGSEDKEIGIRWVSERGMVKALANTHRHLNLVPPTWVLMLFFPPPSWSAHSQWAPSRRCWVTTHTETSERANEVLCTGLQARRQGDAIIITWPLSWWHWNRTFRRFSLYPWPYSTDPAQGGWVERTLQWRHKEVTLYLARHFVTILSVFQMFY